MTSICLEGILGIVSQGPPSRSGESAQDREKFENWIKSNPDGVSDRFANRLRGFLGMLGQRRPVDALRDWQEHGILSVAKEDVDAWQNTRNPSAHGKLVGPAPDRDQLQTRMSRYHRLQNLINRIVLHLVGFRGRYVDYAQPGWVETDFPIAPGGAL